ncbi:MAG: mechanosensitive ion channel [Oligoflexia bacterium]|nr:mechanosensitive ion channel [Oligoflexia bacterium]
MKTLSIVFYRSNTLWDLFISIAITVIAIFILIIIKRYFLARLKKYTARTTTKIDDELVTVADNYLVPMLLIGVIYFSINRLDLSNFIIEWLNRISIFFLTVIITLSLTRIIVFAIISKISHENKDSIYVSGSEKRYDGFITLIKMILWFLSAIFLLDNLGFKISTFITGLGIGGIAIALATQTFLGDLFNYFVILFDKPFIVGDFIISICFWSLKITLRSSIF